MASHWEKVHGLNPNRAADAPFNPDHDGLKDLAEFQNGSPDAQITELEFEDGTTNLVSVDLACSGDGGDD